MSHRITGDRQWERPYGRGFEKVAVAVDATKLAYAEVLAEKQEQTLIGILSRGVAWVNGQGNHYADIKGYECRRGMSEIGPS
ncbi:MULTISPECIES: hypothetical protein [unclassified Synechococcus]|uniref:hypothetical protein n=1 Tax=unclassified Synechococcus TaxID=2626047 RepID=UPI001C2311BA|nr:MULTISPECIES: hypothetical protein [unclassified Synechococcus]